MKVFLFIFLISLNSFSSNEILLSESNYYLDDYNQTISPEVGLEVKGALLDGRFQDDFYFGSGFIQQPLWTSPAESLNGWFYEVIYKLQYSIDKRFQIIGGCGFVNNRQAYGGGLDNHLSIGIQYKIR